MKQTTKTAIYRRFGKENVCAMYYCEAQKIMNRLTASVYNAGLYGWNCDVYIFNGFALATGYRPFGVHYPKVHAICAKYAEIEKPTEDDARAMVSEISDFLKNLNK